MGSKENQTFIKYIQKDKNLTGVNTTKENILEIFIYAGRLFEPKYKDETVLSRHSVEIFPNYRAKDLEIAKGR